MKTSARISCQRKETLRLRKNERTDRKITTAQISKTEGGAGQADDFLPVYSSASTEKLLRTFVGREDIYSTENTEHFHGQRFAPVLSPLTEAVVNSHLNGKLTIGTYIQRSNGTVRYFVADIDVSKKILLQNDLYSETGKAYLVRASGCAAEVQRILRHMGLESRIEFTGNRGYHVWVMFEEWIPARYANLLGDLLERKISPDTDLTIEFFPNKTRIRPGKYGQVLRLPYGVHGKSGIRSRFLDEAMNPVDNIDELCDTFPTVSLPALKRALSAGSVEAGKPYQEPVKDSGKGNEKGNSSFVIEEYGELPETITKTLRGCSLMRYLCEKARTTKYLTHFERLTLLYVFGHIGPEGKEFLHTVLSYTLNYQYHVTERFIRKLPERPISCIKLREQYRNITAELGCSCVFRRLKGCYPSPVLYAVIRNVDSEETSRVTLPMSRSASRDTEDKVLSEISINAKVQQLAMRIQELKKQKRRLDSSIKKTERELETIFDTEHIESLELDIGLLVRRKTDSGYEWLIEI